jgi:hypothetical protein
MLKKYKNNINEKVSMKRFIFIFAILLSLSALCSQESVPADVTTAGTDSVATTPADSTLIAEPVVPELTEEQKMCKQAAEDFMAVYESWDVTKDYEIILPRITAYAEDYYKAGRDPNEVNREDLGILKTNYDRIIESSAPDYLKSFISYDLERVNAELSGTQKNPALLGYLEKTDFDKLKAIEESFAKESLPSLSNEISAVRNSYKNLRRYSIGFDQMLNKIYSEVTRVTDKRIYFLYIEEGVKSPLDEISVRLGDQVRSKKEVFEAQIKEKIDRLYAEKEAAKAAGDRSLEDRLYNQWIEARKVNINNLYNSEVSRLSAMMGTYQRSPGVYDVSPLLVQKLITKSSDTEEYLTTILKAKFYQDLNSKFKNYFRFEVEKGFRKYRTNVFIASFFFFILFFYVYTTVRKKRDTIFIRRIPGLDAIDDAVGRATEMGKPIIYDSGLGGFSSPQTIASMLILRSVAKKVAEFKAEIIYPAYDPIVLQVAEEMIASGFLDAGYPEDHKKDNCFFMVSDQFAYAAGLAGLISRKKPATALHFGHYAAESLLISEAGFAAGAIQVAATADATQLPFFITSCDYTLIGEELYAAAAYMSRDTQVLSNLKLSDYGKVIFGFLFLLGTIMLTINSDWTFISDLLSTH